MQIYTVRPGETLPEIARLTGRRVRDIAVCNGISPASRPKPGQQLYIPAPEGSLSEGRPPLMLCGKVRAGRRGTFFLRELTFLSLLLSCKGMILPSGELYLPRGARVRARSPLAPIPCLLCPEVSGTPALPPRGVADALAARGYAGLCIPSAPHIARMTEGYAALADELHEQELYLALICESEPLLASPGTSTYLFDHADLLLVLPQESDNLEALLSALSSVYPRRMRRRMLLSLDEKKDRAGNGRGQGEGRSPGEYALGVRRLAEDGYCGAVTAVGETAIGIYTLLHETGRIISPSQRNGVRSHR